MKEVFECYVESTLGGDSITELSSPVYDVNYDRFLPENMSAKILDIGPGIGRLMMFLKNCGYSNVKGVDISPSSVRSCKKKDLDCELADSTSDWLKRHAVEFDFIALLDVIEHIPKKDIIDFLSAIRGSLNTGGVLIIQTNNMQAEYAQLMRYGDITHELGFCESTLRQVCSVAGFNQVEVFGMEPWCLYKKWCYIKKKPFTAALHFCGVHVRSLYWVFVRLLRRINGNHCPHAQILNPMFFAIARK